MAGAGKLRDSCCRCRPQFQTPQLSNSEAPRYSKETKARAKAHQEQAIQTEGGHPEHKDVKAADSDKAVKMQPHHNSRINWYRNGQE
uniref:Uncharacterized protein n=1 Tax=Sphaerodactylus townsendi TaxID=933632 RepID=A0ACB8F5A0_9SAUR